MRKPLLAMLSVVTAAALAISGCSGNKNEPTASGENGSPGASPGASGEASKAPDKSPIKISINSIDPKFSPDNDVAQKLAELTGVTLDLQFVVGDLTQKLDLWLAGGDYPDMVVMHPKEVGKYIDAGAVIPLEDLIDQYGPNIKKAFGKYYNLLKAEDGHIYTLPAPYLAEETPADWEAPWAVQYDVLREAGYPEIKTLDQLFDILKAYYEKHPTIDGKPTIPWSGVGGADHPDWILNNPAFQAAGKPDHSWFLIDASNNVTLNILSDYQKRYDKFLNKLYLNGMLDKEFFTINYDEAEAKTAQGRTLAGSLPAWFLKYPEQSLRGQGKPERQFANIELLFDENTPDHSNTITPINSNNNWQISKNAKDPARIIQYVDFLLTDEGQKLINWGIEGKHYDVVNGKRVVNAAWKAKKTEDPEYEFKSGPTGPFYWFTYGDGAKLSDGDYATPNTKDYWVSTYDDATKELLSKYNKKVFSDFMAPVERVPAWIWQLAEPTEGRAEFKRVQQVYKKESPKIVYSKTDEEFEANWNRYAEEIRKAGSAKVEAAYDRIWKAYIDQYNKTMGQ
ncbi:extracellular solute-binding protein [Cohnella nanjingensis]|uniref:Extracellular solute-binding protein n=2 Tax=Cohnella nanjingensis TaxID=1387779 RepID=A0A7X0RQD2_9BACL|nr:extracellular solute-binding protein [Cohnella nanjingensis]